VSYPPQPGYPPHHGGQPQQYHPAPQQYGAPPPGYGYYPPRPPSPALAYLGAAIFVVCAGLAMTFAFISWDGTTDNANVLAAVVGMAFSDDLTGNVDFAITTSMIVAGVTLLFALLGFARLEPIRWILGILGGIVTAYYLYALIWLLSHDAAKYIGLAALAFILWLSATIITLLPATSQAMRGRQSVPRY
jgi:hypothetical protein